MVHRMSGSLVAFSFHDGGAIQVGGSWFKTGGLCPRLQPNAAAGGNILKMLIAFQCA